MELRERRLASGLAARELARLIGTTESNVSAYETGAKQPGEKTGERIRRAIAAGADSVIVRHHLATAASAAAAVRRSLRGSGDGEMFRHLRELISNAAELETDADWELFSAEPSTTTDKAWDAAVAATIDFIARTREFPRPAWTSLRHAKPWLFVGRSDGLHAYAFAWAPPEFAMRGVFVDPDDLVPV